ncbi:MAG: SRPBCC family protein [Candidatus Hydrogenedentes bacterium]|nr:SRPBCC family protein [Candidatus Hydrogenedentota bacterium]
MKRTILVLFAAIAIAVAGLLAYAATRPSEFHVERSLAIAAPASAVFPHVNDLHKWEAWSPWDKLDPALKRTYDGAESGVGAAYSWAGNSDVGEGKMTITESTPNERIVIKLEFFTPVSAVNVAQLTFKPEGAGTRVAWSMDGTNNFAAKVFTLFMDLDKMIGGDFEKGLASLKSIAETAPAK